jgi:hypothetical protein
MGYSFDDFFEEHVVPKLTELFKDPDFAKGEDVDKEISDRFFDVLRSSIQMQYRGGDLARRLIEVAINPDGEELSPDLYLRKFFNQKYDDMELELRKIEYSSIDGTIINVNYRGEMEEQEREEKLIEQLADKKSGKF